MGAEGGPVGSERTLGGGLGGEEVGGNDIRHSHGGRDLRLRRGRFGDRRESPRTVGESVPRPAQADAGGDCRVSAQSEWIQPGGVRRGSPGGDGPPVRDQPGPGSGAVHRQPADGAGGGVPEETASFPGSRCSVRARPRRRSSPRACAIPPSPPAFWEAAPSGRGSMFRARRSASW